MWNKKREQIKKDNKSSWPPLDWPKSKEGNQPVPPKRLNFIDETVQWATSYNDEKKSKELREQLAPKGIFEPPKKKEVPNLRDKFLEDEKKENERKAGIPKVFEWRVQSIENADARLKEDQKNYKTQVEKDLMRYTKEKPQWPRCDRVTVMADAEYIGETIPFYNTFSKEGEKVEKLFFPKKEFTLRRNPIWTFDNKNRLKGLNDQMKSRDASINEKVSNYVSSKNLKPSDLYIDIERAQKLMDKRARLPLTIHKPFDYSNEEHYKKAREEHPEYSPSACEYWKMKAHTEDSNVKPPAPETTTLNGKEVKVFYLNRKRTDNVIFKPMRASVY